MSRIHVTVVLLKPFWKAAKDFQLTLFHPCLPVCPEHLHALVQRFAGVNASLRDIRDVCFCPLSRVSCALMRPVILNGATLFSWIRIFP